MSHRRKLSKTSFRDLRNSEEDKDKKSDKTDISVRDYPKTYKRGQ